MKLNGFADIDFFIQQLAVLKTGTAIEKSVAVSGLRRILTHVKQLASEGIVTLEVSYLEKSSSACNGWEGMASSDEYYDCSTNTQSKTGVSFIVRNSKNVIVRSAVFALSVDLAHEIFGNAKCVVELGILPVDPSILNEDQIVEVTESVESEEEDTKDDSSSSSEEETEEASSKEETSEEQKEKEVDKTNNQPAPSKSDITSIIVGGGPKK